MSLRKLFGLARYETLSDAVRAGDLKAVGKMLAAGADPGSLASRR